MSAHSLLSSSVFSLGSLASTVVSSVLSVGSLSTALADAVGAGQKKSLAAAGPARLSAQFGSKFSVDSFGAVAPGQRLSPALGGGPLAGTRNVFVANNRTASQVETGPLRAELQRLSLDSEEDDTESDGSLLTSSSMRFV